MRYEPDDQDASVRLAREIAEEKAAALRRIGEQLERLLASIAAARAAIALADGPDIAGLVADHDALVDQAELWSWYLVVQRESLGLRTHHEVGRVYAIPPRIGSERSA